MIRNWNFHNLYMDYSSYVDTNNHPSDIDMFYIGKNQTLIVGEIKMNQANYQEAKENYMSS